MNFLPFVLVALALVIGCVILAFAWRLTESKRLRSERRHIRVFFYGLFMNTSLLQRRGLHPRVIAAASLPDFRIRIGDRATLLRHAGATSYGILVELPADEVIELYSTASVADYISESVEVIPHGRDIRVSAACFNLPEDKLGQGANTEYARQLSELAHNLGFPADYIRQIDTFCD